MPSFKVEPSALEREAGRIEGTADSLGHAVRELLGVQHAQNAADSPEVAAAMVALVEQWGAALANLVTVIGDMAEKLHAAGSCYVSTDAQAGGWAQSMMSGLSIGVADSKSG